MANALNRSLVEGRLTRDPSLFYTKNGTSICKFDIAVNYNFKLKGEKASEVSFITINTWNKTADACAQYLKKGSKVRVKGRLKQDTWLKQNGEKTTKIHIEAASIEFLGTPKKKELLKAG